MILDSLQNKEKPTLINIEDMVPIYTSIVSGLSEYIVNTNDIGLESPSTPPIQNTGSATIYSILCFPFTISFRGFWKMGDTNIKPLFKSWKELFSSLLGVLRLKYAGPLPSLSRFCQTYVLPMYSYSHLSPHHSLPPL